MSKKRQIINFENVLFENRPPDLFLLIIERLPMGERFNFEPEDLVKIFEFIGVMEPYFDHEELETENLKLTDIKN